MKHYERQKNWWVRMMENKIFNVTCERCGIEFQHTNCRKKYCEPCREIIKRERNRKHMQTKRHPEKNQTFNIPLRKVIYLLERYNTKHKTHYSYGNFIKMLNTGEIQIDDL